MAEIITDDQPRIKFETRWVGPVNGTPRFGCDDDEVARLAALQNELEAQGVIPILCDGLVGGNCAIRLPTGDLLISKSGKPPSTPLCPSDMVELTSFDRATWTAAYRSPSADIRPSSDSPLHYAALAKDSCERYCWGASPSVAVHGHALAEGAGVEAAQRAGMPISDKETLFSTPDDLEALEVLFREFPYPEHRCFIRRGHGFFLLARDVAEAEHLFQALVLPLIPPY